MTAERDYGDCYWRIDVDHLDPEAGGASDVGTSHGPGFATTVGERTREYGRAERFTIYDDDGIKYYSGTGHGDFWDSVIEWAMWNAGATEIRDSKGKAVIG